MMVNKWSELHTKRKALKVAVRQGCSLQCVCTLSLRDHIKVCCIMDLNWNELCFNVLCVCVRVCVMCVHLHQTFVLTRLCVF